VAEPVAYLYASIAGPVVLHRLKQIGVAKPLFSQKQVDDDLEAASEWPKAHSMTPLYTKQEWQGLTDAEIEEFENMELGTHDLCLEIEAKLQEKNGG
jgi:hypothetical protein